MGRKLLKPGTKAYPEDLCIYVQDLRSETQTAMGKVKDKLTRPDMLREEAYVRVIFGLRPTPRPGLPWAERQADLVRDGQVLAQARAEALAWAQAEALAKIRMDAEIKARRESQALARDREEVATRRPGEFPSWLSHRQEDTQDAFGDQWALTHEPLGKGLPTPDQIRKTAVSAGLDCGLNKQDGPWDLPSMVVAENKGFGDDNPKRAEWKVRKENKLRERDQAYYEQPWPARQPELVMDGWRRVLGKLHEKKQEMERFLVNHIPDLPWLKRADRRLEAVGHDLKTRNQAAQEVARAARDAQAIQRAAEVNRAPQGPSRPPKIDKGRGRGA
jgi:hypothetical protein